MRLIYYLPCIFMGALGFRAPFKLRLIQPLLDKFTSRSMSIKTTEVLAELPPNQFHYSLWPPAVSSNQLVDNFELAYFSLCPSDKILSFECICDNEYSDVNVIEDKELAAASIVAAHHQSKQLVVSYRFTMGMRNWITNFDFPLVPMSRGPSGVPENVRVSRGVYQHYLALHNQTMYQMQQLVNREEYRDYSILVTGYSLGASVAAVSVPFWYEFINSQPYRERIKIQIIPYSGARVGDINFLNYVRQLDIPITRYSNNNDIVSLLPSRAKGFVHIGAELHERTLPDGSSQFITCDTTYDEDPNCTLQFNERPSAIRHAFPLNKLVPLPPYCNRDGGNFTEGKFHSISSGSSVLHLAKSFVLGVV